MDEFKGRVTRVFTTRDNWAAGKIKCIGHGEIGFAGNCYPTVGTNVTLYGELKYDPKWGKQIKVESSAVDFNFTAQALTDYLTDEVRFHNIGPVRARDLVDTFGAEGFQELAASPTDFHKLTQIAGVTAETAEGIHQHWIEAQAVHAVMLAFRAYGLDHSTSVKVVRTLGSGALTLLQTDPYRLIDLTNVSFAAVDKVERAKGMATHAPQRIAGYLVELLRTHKKDGHTRMDLEFIYAERPWLTRKAIKAASAYRRKIKQIAFVVGEVSIALEPLYHAERDFTQWLLDALDYPSQISQRAVGVTAPSELNSQQAAAFKLCLTNSVTWIFGLAGTGKTYTAKRICDAYEQAGGKVLCLAPTGKAAKRLEESTDRPAATIHRGLMCRVKANMASKEVKFTFEGEPLDVALVLIDEVSMIDSELMGHLIRRIDLRKTSVIFLGDVNQLTPVSAGQPAVDVYRADYGFPTIELTEIVRQAGKLAHYCVDVLSSKVRMVTDVENGWIVRECASTPDAIHKALLEALESDWLLEHDTFREVQVLIPQKIGPIGAHYVNMWLQHYYQAQRYGVATDMNVPKPEYIKILSGDKVIQTRNDYDLGIFNGDTGIVLDVVTDMYDEHKKGSILVDFGFEDPIWLLTSGGASDKNQTTALKLAYALTVHKSQGSEYPVAIVITDQAHKHMLTRSLLYTAVTRSKSQVCLLGQHKAAVAASRRIHSPHAKAKGGRQTMIYNWLRSSEDSDA